MRLRSSYPKSFKAQVVQDCLQLGATISSVAISHGINANVIRKWMPLHRGQPAASLPAFAAFGMPRKSKWIASSFRPCAGAAPGSETVRST
ncbi:hypothetical protein CUN63_07540 [Pseudomonas sp. ACM7]|nr:hypothetical protein CUN63_07540 [Pseudomonas sp. ACM7]